MSGLDDSHKVVNRSSQFEVRKKEKLYSGEQFANPRKHNLRWKPEMCFPETRRCPPFIKKVPILFPNWSIFMQMKTSDLHSLFGPNSTVLIGWKPVLWCVGNMQSDDLKTCILVGHYGAALIGHYRCKWGCRLDSTGLSPLVKRWGQVFPYELAGTQCRKLIARSMAFPCNARCMGGLCCKWLLDAGYEFVPS